MTMTSPIRTHCPYCAFQCGMLVSPDGESGELQIEADPEFPVNNGQMCIKGWNAAALLRNPERILQPQLRDADGVMQTVSWEQALDFVAGRLQEIRQQHGNDAIGLFGSGALTNEKAYLLGKFARVAIGTPHIDYNGRYCMASAAGANNKALGIDRGLPFPVSDIAGAHAILLWGSNCADTLPPIMQWFAKQRENGGRLAVVDPRRSATAAEADLHLQPTPGTDLALANGLLYIAIEEKLIDLDYIRERTSGFDAVRRTVLGYPPDFVERITGVSEDRMRVVVRWLAGSDSAMVLSGRGSEQQSKGVDTVLAMINLMLALGKVGKPCSGYGCLTGQGNGQGGRELGQKADQLPGYRLIENPDDRRAVAQVWGVDPDSLPKAGLSAYELLDSMQPGGIRGLIVVGSNVAVASPNSDHIRRRLAGLDLLVVLDAFHNHTSRSADVFLPTLQWAEEDGTLTNLEGRVIRRRKVVEPPAGPKSDEWIMAELAERLGCATSFHYSASTEVFDELGRATAGSRSDYHGVTYEKIDCQDGVFWPCPEQEHSGTPRLFAERFAHPDGRARFHAVEHRDAGELPCDEYPLYFTTGRYKEHYNSGAQTRMVGKLREARPEPRLQIHPRKAHALNLSDGDWVEVSSRRGNAVFRVDLKTEIRPDTVFAPFHWGGRRAANAVTNPELDPTSRMPEFKVCAVAVKPVSEEKAQDMIEKDTRR